ncbi:MAG TPA: hypothetical protein PLY93_03580, partial [Turneriella sp.]|nr:hypothetical protein [Turneriella sp.]
MRIKLFILFILTPPLFASYTFKDAILSLEAQNQGAKTARSLVELANRMSEHLTYDMDTKKFFNFMNGALEDFDFARIYESAYLQSDVDGFKSLALAGQSIGGGYRVSIQEKMPPQKLGNSLVRYRMRQNRQKNQTTYTTQVIAQLFTGSLSGRDLMRFLVSLLKVYDPQNIESLKTAPLSIFPELQEKSRVVLDQAQADLPQTTTLFSKFISLSSLASIQTQNQKKYTAIQLRGYFRMEALKNTYPQFYQFLKRWRNLFVGEVYISDVQGQNIASLIFNSNTQEFYVAFKTAQGKLLPTRKDGSVRFEDAIALDANSTQKFFIAARASINVYGLKIDTGYISLFTRYILKPHELSVRTKVTHIPQGKIKGALLGVVPTWMIDLSIPSNLEELMNRFSQTLFQAN